MSENSNAPMVHQLAHTRIFSRGFPAIATEDRMGSPIFVSNPLFLDADPVVRDGCTGLPEAEREKHSLVLLKEPDSGITLITYKRIQINVRLNGPMSPSKPGQDRVVWFENMTQGEVYVPMMWSEENAMVTDETADLFKLYYMVDGLGIACLVIGLAGAAASVVYGVFILIRRKRAEELAAEKLALLDEERPADMTGLLSPVTFF